MLASKPCFLHSYSSDTRFIFIVENIPQKLEQNRPMKKLFYFSILATIRPPSLCLQPPKIHETKVSKKQVKIGHQTDPFGHRL